MSRIDSTFAALRAQGRKAFIPFVTAGDPDPALTVAVMQALADNGADVIELGVPFSDPMADGPTIQRASERALAKGMTLARVLAIASEFRAANPGIPVVLMGYANPIEAMGLAKFGQAAKAAGVDGVLVVDYPPEESEAFAACMTENGLDPIFLLAPTTTDARMAQIAAVARGYIYYVSLKGVTGSGTLDLGEIAGKVASIRAQSGLPVGVGFGIRDARTAAAIAAIADAVVVGSRLIEAMESAGHDRALEAVAALAAEIRAGVDTASKG
ncbi:MAG TPA: tryptophan synthase subunit alpha [Rhodocyclaceae bacterium]